MRLDSNRHLGGVIDGESDHLVCLSFGVGGNGVVAILGNGLGHDINSLCSLSASVQYNSKSPSPALNLLENLNATNKIAFKCFFYKCSWFLGSHNKVLFL